MTIHTYILPRVRRHRASSPQGSSKNGCCHFAGHHGPINVCLSFSTPTYNSAEVVSSITVSVCVCVCLFSFFPFILDIKFVGRTSRDHTGGRSHRISRPPSFCGACLNFSREGFSHSFPSSTVKSNFAIQQFNRSPPVGHLRPNVSEGYLEVPLSYRGDRHKLHSDFHGGNRENVSSKENTTIIG